MAACPIQTVLRLIRDMLIQQPVVAPGGTIPPVPIKEWRRSTATNQKRRFVSLKESRFSVYLSPNSIGVRRMMARRPAGVVSTETFASRRPRRKRCFNDDDNAVLRRPAVMTRMEECIAAMSERVAR